MHNAQFMKILNAALYLLEKFTGFFFLQFLFFYNIVKQLSTTNILHNKKQFAWCFNNFKQLDYVWMSDHFQNFDFSSHTLHICFFDYLTFLKDFYCYLLQRLWLGHSKLKFLPFLLLKYVFRVLLCQKYPHQYSCQAYNSRCFLSFYFLVPNLKTLLAFLIFTQHLTNQSCFFIKPWFQVVICSFIRLRF